MNDTYSVKPPVSNFDNDDSEDFATLFEATQISNGRSGQEESKVVADIVSIGDEWIFLDIGGKTEGIISKEEFLDDNGVLTVKKGDPITAYIIRKRDGEILLSTKMTLAASSEAAREAFQRGIPVEGLVCEERKGGFSVKVFGKSAFCPYSQIDLSSAKPAPEYLGKKFSFKVTEYSDRGKNIVLSRRRILEEERLEKIEELKKRFKLEDIVIGSVKRLESFGAFVDIGGIEGLVPISEISWGRVEDISCFLSIDQNIAVKLINLDWDRNRISLSVKRAMEDPWSLVESSYKVGAIVTGNVTRLTNFGAFLELEPGVEGLIHISNLGQGRRINHPREVISTGLTLNVRVISVDASARRIGLELERETQENDEKADVELKPGLIVTGTVDSIQEYGLFIKLPGGKTGLLHVSEMVSAKSVDAKKKYPPGSSIDIQILTVDEQSDRISLSLKSLGSLSEKKQVEDFRARGASPQSFGTLGDLFKEKLLKK